MVHSTMHLIYNTAFVDELNAELDVRFDKTASFITIAGVLVSCA